MKNLLFALVLLWGMAPLTANAEFNSKLLEKIENKITSNPLAGNITVLFVYTKRVAKEIGGGAPEIKKQVDNGMNLLNEALNNSQIGYQAKAIAQFVEVDMDEDVTDARALLRELGQEDGKYNKIHQIRQQKQADIVCLIFSGEMKGIANLYGDLMVCHYSTFDGSYVFPHEFGHNLGAVHSNKDGEVAYSRKYHFNFRGNWYRTVSNNGGISIPYFSEDRTINYAFKYQDEKSEWKTETKTIKLGDADYNNAATMRKQAPKTAQFGEQLKPVPSVMNAYAVRLVDPSTEPIPAGGKVNFESLGFVYNEKTQLATWTYNASQMYVNDRNDYEIIVLDPFGEQVNGFFKQGSLNAGYPYKVEASFKKFSLPNGYVAEMKPGSKIQLWYTENGGELKLRKEIQVGDPIEFAASDDPDLIKSFVVDEKNGDITIKYKNIRANIPFSIEFITPSGGKGSSGGRLNKNDTELINRSHWQEAPVKGTVYKLFVNNKHVKTYTVGEKTASPDKQSIADRSDPNPNDKGQGTGSGVTRAGLSSGGTNGNNSTATDLDGNTYETIQIGDQVWMIENLKATKCADGTPIAEGLYKKDWKDRMIYNYSAIENCDVCPSGWRVPTKQDIKDLKKSGLSVPELKSKLNWNRETLGGNASNIHVQGASFSIYSDSDLTEILEYGYGWTTKGGANDFYGIRCIKASGN